MRYKKVKAYLKQANKIQLTNSIAGAMDLKKELVGEFEKEDKGLAEMIKSISFFPHYQTASNDIASQERRGQAMRNGMQEMINILNEVCDDKREKRDNLRFWIPLIIAIVSLIIAFISIF